MIKLHIIILALSVYNTITKKKLSFGNRKPKDSFILPVRGKKSYPESSSVWKFYEHLLRLESRVWAYGFLPLWNPQEMLSWVI